MTAETFQSERGWLKADAIQNMKDVLVTAETSQSEMSPLKAPVP